MKLNPNNFVDPDNRWCPTNTINADWETPRAHLLYDCHNNVIVTIPFKLPIGYDVTTS
jgi:hypothetical protein